MEAPVTIPKDVEPGTLWHPTVELVDASGRVLQSTEAPSIQVVRDRLTAPVRAGSPDGFNWDVETWPTWLRETYKELVATPRPTGGPLSIRAMSRYYVHEGVYAVSDDPEEKAVLEQAITAWVQSRVRKELGRARRGQEAEREARRRALADKYRQQANQVFEGVPIVDSGGKPILSKKTGKQLVLTRNGLAGAAIEGEFMFQGRFFKCKDPHKTGRFKIDELSCVDFPWGPGLSGLPCKIPYRVLAVNYNTALGSELAWRKVYIRQLDGLSLGPFREKHNGICLVADQGRMYMRPADKVEPADKRSAESHFDFFVGRHQNAMDPVMAAAERALGKSIWLDSTKKGRGYSDYTNFECVILPDKIAPPNMKRPASRAAPKPVPAKPQPSPPVHAPAPQPEQPGIFHRLASAVGLGGSHAAAPATLPQSAKSAAGTGKTDGPRVALIRTGLPSKIPYGLKGVVAAFGEAGPNGEHQVRTKMRAGRGGSIITVTCHELMAPVWKDIFDEIFERGLAKHLLQGPGSTYDYRRNVNSKSKLSSHAWGIAIDINSRTNKNHQSEPTEENIILAPLWEARGFYWGRHFNDPMHFQYCRGY